MKTQNKTKPTKTTPSVVPGETRVATKKPTPKGGGVKKLLQIQPAFPIVGVGASAGGLAAFEAFFSGMPADTDPGMAFVLVQHLSPDHKSILADLVQRYTRMEVFEVTDGMVVRPNCTYIIPPNRDMALLNGILHLVEQVAIRGQRLPIDFFFRSLAQDQRERSICIVLSGTGSDGTLGARAVKGEGGIVMAQTPTSTEYDGMPRSVIATGMVDFELPPEEMPSQLISYTLHTFGKGSLNAIYPTPKAENAMKKIFILLRSQVGHDFSLYKQSTIQRRIERRMAVNQIATIDEYVSYLLQNPPEVELLFRDLLIGVTNFFRDPEAFKIIEEQVIPKIFAGKLLNDGIRFWSPGCSSGEEPYSLAILLAEHQEKLKKHFKVQVFATDIDRHAITVARAGLFPASISSDISPERLVRYFTAEAGGTAYRINKSIRDMVIFSEQDVIKDPPFSKLDLISCRNVMIYMGPELQKKLIPLFHYALKPRGVLFLGTSETVGEFDDYFMPLDRKLKVYQRQDDFQSARRAARERFLPPRSLIDDVLPPTYSVKTMLPAKLPLRELTEQALLKQLAPDGALVNNYGDILYLHGRTGLYLELPAGEPEGYNLLKLAREGLRQELTTLLHQAAGTKEIVNRQGLSVKIKDDITTLDLTICPVPAGQVAMPDVSVQSGSNMLYLVIIEEAPAPILPSGILLPDTSEQPSNDASLVVLKQELRAKEEYLQAANEELETGNEELKSSNEEMQSVNEELQSTNEELETSKEELQSVNEELSTVNAELQTHVADLSQLTNDMNNLLAGSGIATVFVDHHLCILRFTPNATKIINLILSDVGRPVSHISSNLVGFDHLTAEVKKVLDTLVSKEIEVQTKTGEWYLMRIQPYRTLENVIEGAVLTFVDITEMKKIREALRKANDLQRLAVVVRDSHDAITVQDLEGHILAWNASAERMYGWSEAEALKMNIRDLIPEGTRKDALGVIKRLRREDALEPYRMQRIAKDGSIIDVWMTATALVNETGQVYAIATTERNLGLETNEPGSHEGAEQ